MSILQSLTAQAMRVQNSTARENENPDTSARGALHRGENNSNPESKISDAILESVSVIKMPEALQQYILWRARPTLY